MYIDSIDEATSEIRQQVLEYFRGGNSVNHICFLLNYEIRIDVVTQIIRERLKQIEDITDWDGV